MKKLLPDSLHLTTVLVASASTNAHNLAMKAGTLGEALYATAAGSLPPETMAGSLINSTCFSLIARFIKPDMDPLTLSDGFLDCKNPSPFYTLNESV